MQQAQRAQVRENSEQQLDNNFTNPGPVWDPPEDATAAERHITLQTHAVSDVDKDLLRNFSTELYSKEMRFCGRGKEKWFDMVIVDGVCNRCLKTDKDADIFFYWAANNMEFGDVTAVDLPKLSDVEAMMISKVLVALECRQIRGAQFKYSGHICHFLRDVGKVYRVLPIMPEDLPIVLINPNNERLHNAPLRDFRCRSWALGVWLRFLKLHNPEYRYIEISNDSLKRLENIPNENVGNLLPVRLALEDNGEEAYVDPDITDAALLDMMDQNTVSAVPDLVPDVSETAQIQRTLAVDSEAQAREHDLAAQGQMEMPAFQSPPNGEFDQSIRFWAAAYPDLLPYGTGDPRQLRERSATEDECVDHALKWHDGRFARHKRWPYHTLNRKMRRQVREQSSFSVRNTQRDNEMRFTVQELDELLNSNDPAHEQERENLIKSLMRNGYKIHGSYTGLSTAAIWMLWLMLSLFRRFG